MVSKQRMDKMEDSDDHDSEVNGESEDERESSSKSKKIKKGYRGPSTDREDNEETEVENERKTRQEQRRNEMMDAFEKGPDSTENFVPDEQDNEWIKSVFITNINKNTGKLTMNRDQISL